MQLDLSEKQRRTVAAGVTILALFVIVCAFGTLIWLLARFVNAFSGVLLPLAVAGIAALVMNPYFEWLQDRMPTALAVAVVFLSILLPVAGFLWFFGALVVRQIAELVQQAPETWRTAVAWVEGHWPQVVDFMNNHPLGQRIREVMDGQTANILPGMQLFSEKAVNVGAALFRFVGSLFSWAVMPVYLAFFLILDANKIGPLESYMPFLKAETRRDLAFLVNEFVRIMVSFFRGQLIVAFLMGVLFATGFSLIGLKYGFVLGLVLGFLNIIPYLGSIVGLTVALPLAFFQRGGGIWLVVGVVVVFTVVQMIEGYLLTPKVMGDRTGLHPMVIIVAVFFWGSALGGIMGMILAIPLTAFLVVFWRLAQERYIEEWV